MKITKDQLKQIIKEEMEDSLMDEGIFDDMKKLATRAATGAIGKLGRGGKSSFKTSEEVLETFNKQFIIDLPNDDMRKQLAKAAQTRGDDGLDQAVKFSDTETAVRRIQAFAIQEVRNQVNLAKAMNLQRLKFVTEVSNARKQKRDPNFSRAKANLKIKDDKDMRRAIAILYSGWRVYPAVRKSIEKSEMFELVLTPQNPFEMVRSTGETALKDFYQKKVSGRTTTEAAHDAVLAIWAYLTSLKEAVEQNNALFKSTLQAALPKRQLNKALEESKMKITKTQLRQIIKEELESMLEAEPTPPPIAEPRPNFQGATRSKQELKRLYDEALKKFHGETLKKIEAIKKYQNDRYKEFEASGAPSYMAQSFMSEDPKEEYERQIRPEDFGSSYNVHYILSTLMNKGRMSKLGATPLTGEEIKVLTGKTIEQARKQYKKIHGHKAF